MSDIQISSEKFYQRLSKLIEGWQSNKLANWSNADSICILLGTREEDESTYSKSSALHLYLLGYEITDSVIIITKTHFWFMASEKKCKYLETALTNQSSTIIFQALPKTKDEGMNRENFNKLLGVARKCGHNVGMLMQTDLKGPFMQAWQNSFDQSQLEKVDVALGLALMLAVKDEAELDSCKRAAVLTNKVLKHSFVTEMEGIIDEGKKAKHDELATKVEAVITDPSKIGLNVAPELVDACYTPIIQSGGKYDIKISAQSDSSVLSPDVIICSLGAKYKGYCANVARTFMVNVPPKVESTYSILVSLFDACLEQMVPGKELKDVYAAAKEHLTKKDQSLVSSLPKSLGFATGLEFRDSLLVLNEKNTNKFTDGMVFSLIVGLHNIALPADGAKSTLTTFSLLLADTVRVQRDGAPEILTKMSKEFGDVSYTISDDKDDDNEDDEDEDKENSAEGDGKSRPTRRAKETKMQNEVAAVERAAKQKELMDRKISDALKKFRNEGGDGDDNIDDSGKAAVDLKTYLTTKDYPRDVNPMQVRVDMEKEALFLPINGRSVPFHVSTIKSVTRPEEDKATWMRVNFFVPGASVKEAPKNMQQLVAKYGGRSVFIKELTFRAVNPRNLVTAYQMFQELRKRVKQREQKAEQEKDLVVQMKLIRIKDQRVPRLQDLTMRPQLTGRKCVGTLEAHQNGLRFTSTKGEVLDVMYANIKHAIYQPCDKTTMVLVHFHLKDFILIGKKKQKDVQFYTDVIDASVNLDGARRSSYDPDELDEEQREKEMKKRLNLLFKEFCIKVEKVAAHYGYQLQVDIPFRKSGFEGNCHKEMVFMQPTTHCLVNLTEVPAFVLPLGEIDHVHFERVTYTTRNFDATFIFKNHSLPPKTITAIDMRYLEVIQDWLNLVEITYTAGGRSINWTEVMAAVRDAGEFFYMDTDENGDKQVAGWLFLSAEESDDEEGEEGDDDDESFQEESDDDSDEDSDDDDDESDFEDEDEDDDDEDDDDEEEDDGKDWEDLEREALASDRAKRKQEEENDDGGARNKKVLKRR